MGKKRCIIPFPFLVHLIYPLISVCTSDTLTSLYEPDVHNIKCLLIVTYSSLASVTYYDIFIDLQLAYLPHKRRDMILDDENIDLYIGHDGNAENPDDTSKEKKSRKNGLLNWLKIRVRANLYV